MDPDPPDAALPPAIIAQAEAAIVGNKDDDPETDQHSRPQAKRGSSKYQKSSGTAGDGRQEDSGSQSLE